MSVLKCKMCGGDLVIEPEMTVCECEYCGTKQTVPNIDDDKKVKLYERANRLRMRGEFDKSGSVYESLIEEFPEDAEAYWGNLLCKYGIEYVDDPATGDKVPTCHRSSFDSFMKDPDFEMVMENSDSVSRSVYRAQAKQIEEIRKGIVEVSGKEQPYDIFICYKETDEDGQRTLDSVLAQDVYDALTDRNYRVFFSRISLEDKLGSEYEPYIFAALNSAKIMLAFGTNYDYYNAVWVKNEWGRFLKLMAKDKSKHLIPCYKNLDAYDIPDEFAKFQAQDMGKVGALQDLLRGINKIMKGDTHIVTPSVQTIIQQVSAGGPNTASLIDRGNMALEDGAFEEAADYFNRALDIDSKAAEAYLGLFMATIRVKNRVAAKDMFITGDYTSERNWSRARQFASDKLSEELLGWENDRKAHLQREVDAARRFEEEREKAKAEIETLKKLIEDGSYGITTAEQVELKRLQDIADKARESAIQAEQSIETCGETQEALRLDNELRFYLERIKSLGIFQKKEKKELQTKIDTLENRLSAGKMEVENRQKEIQQLKEIADQTQKKAADYKEAIISEKKIIIEERISELSLKNVVIGDIVFFGKYEQGKGTRLIEWQVLNKIEDRVLLISKYALDCKQYHGKKTNMTWEKCDLRSWLNKDFLSNVFTNEELGMIEETRCEQPVNPQYSTPAGDATQDKIFLLSISEVEKYFNGNDDRMCLPTANVFAQGVHTSQGNRTWWWLRSPGGKSDRAARVSNDGSVDYYGFSVHDVFNDSGCIRPALWINLGT